MKKNLLTAVMAVFSVVAFAQEKPQNAEKHACTETCNPGKTEAKSEMKACCNAPKGESKDNEQGSSKKSVTAVVQEKKACCSEKKADCADAGKE
ncbi:MAG: hypothetical protein L7S65_08390 [Schleiferiaceae bacterium]|nr:hypothetical protein [Schleiferiaceae bacterium]